MTGRIEAVCISEKKGTVKQDVGRCRILKDFGLEGDAHAGSTRQVSLLSYEKVEEFKKRTGGKVEICPGAFGENLLVSGFDLSSLPIGTHFRIGEVLLELTQIGKTCHEGCEISKLTGECIMPREGVFARVLQGGEVRKGDEVIRPFTACVLTSSDRAYQGIREDISGPAIMDLLQKEGYVVSEYVLIPDEEDEAVKEMIRLCDGNHPDVVFTTGGTGFSPRDRMPEASMRVAERNAPGIAEAIRSYSMTITPRAMLSRGVSVIRGRTLIVNLPGSPKAVKECLSFLLPSLAHGLTILRGEAAD